MTAVGKYATTRAPQLASYGPDVLKAIGEAFDEAWAEIVGNFGNEPQDTERPASGWRRPCCGLPATTAEIEDGARLQAPPLGGRGLYYRRRLLSVAFSITVSRPQSTKLAGPTLPVLGPIGATCSMLISC